MTFGAGGTPLPAQAAELSGWVSPTAQDGHRGNLPARPHDTGVPLSQQVILAGWPTADASVVQDGEGAATWMERRERLKQNAYNGNGCGTPLAMAIQPELAGSHQGDHLPLLEVGVSARIGKLKGFGNSIIAVLGAAVVRAWLDEDENR